MCAKIVVGLGLMLLSSMGLASKDSAQQSFKALSTLVGDWEGVYASGQRHQVSYRLTANGTALIETWTMSATRESMTVYALDSERLLATHYCLQGNQPRLVLKENSLSIVEGNKLEFTFLDGTNLHNPYGSHQHSFWVIVDSPTTFRRVEVYIQNKQEVTAQPITKEEEEVVVYRRVKK